MCLRSLFQEPLSFYQQQVSNLEPVTSLASYSYHCVKSVRIRSFSGLYSVRMRENTKQKNSEYGPSSRSVLLQVLRHFFLRFYVALLASCPRFALVRIFGIVLSVTHLKKTIPEAVVQRCSIKKMFLEISQNSQENTCARVYFLIKLQVREHVFS